MARQVSNSLSAPRHTSQVTPEVMSGAIGADMSWLEVRNPSICTRARCLVVLCVSALMTTNKMHECTDAHTRVLLCALRRRGRCSG